MVYEIVIGRKPGDLERYGTKATVFIGKNYVTMERTTSLANPILLDVARPHVILVCGKRGEGKSYTLAVICEGVAALEEEIAKRIGILIFDTMGIFWTFKHPNWRDEELLEEWGLKPKEFGERIKIWVPHGYVGEYKKEGIPVDEPFAIAASELSGIDWCYALNLDISDPIAILICRAIERLKEKKESYGIDDIIKEIRADREAGKDERGAAISYFEAVKGWGLFRSEGTPLASLVQAGTISVLDLSRYAYVIGGFSVRTLVVGLICKSLIEERMRVRKLEEMEAIKRAAGERISAKRKEQVPLVWLFIDEAHEFLPDKGWNLATGPLLRIIREGRQPGLSLVLATQQPGKIHSDVMTQCDLIIAHRVTSKLDIDALNNIMHTYLPYELQKYLDQLPRRKGAAIVLDDNQERIYAIQIRPRQSWHGGEEPSAIPEASKP